MRLLAADNHAGGAGEHETSYRANYLIGANPTLWRTNVHQYERVKYGNVYPGIDVVYYGNGRKLEYDFIVSPGHDPRTIRLAFHGADKATVSRSGDLVLAMGSARLRWHKPLVYQTIAGRRKWVAGRFAMDGTNALHFEVARYDRTHALVIDPYLPYSTFQAIGFDSEIGTSIAVNAAGNAYVTGTTLVTNLTTTPNALQSTNPADNLVHGFIAKWNAAGTALLYCTYLGGNGTDNPNAIAIDADGTAYVAGQTTSSNFPTTSTAYQRVTPAVSSHTGFVTKIDSTGSRLMYSTYLGGNVFDTVYGIAVGAMGKVYMTGYTASANFPLSAGAVQKSASGTSVAFITVLDTTAQGAASLVYSTFLGGGADTGNGIAVDTAGAIYVTGSTGSYNFPVTPSAQSTLNGILDAFVAKIDPTKYGKAGLIYSTYLGGSGSDSGNAIALDALGNVFVAGSTHSTDFPVTPGAYQTINFGGSNGEAFVSVISPSGDTLIVSTFLGGTGGDSATGISVDAFGDTYVTGTTSSIDFPTTPNALQPTLASGSSALFVAKLNPSETALVYSSYIAGAYGGSSALDPANNIYVTGHINTSSQGGSFIAKYHVLSDYDLNDDGYGDLLLQDQVTGAVVWAFMHGLNPLNEYGTLTIPTEPSWKLVAQPDINGDGMPDLLFQNAKTGDVIYTIVKGTTPVSFGYILHGEPLQWKIVGAPDLNGDGHPDLLWQNAKTGDVAYTLLSDKPPYASTGEWGYIFRNIDPSWHIVGIADLNRDGKPDLLWQNTTTGDVAYHLMNGLVPEHFGLILQGGPLGWKVRGSMDVDGDGQPDLLYQNINTGEVAYVLLDDAASGYAPTGAYGEIVQPVSVTWQVVGAR